MKAVVYWWFSRSISDLLIEPVGLYRYGCLYYFILDNDVRIPVDLDRYRCLHKLIWCSPVSVRGIRIPVSGLLYRLIGTLPTDMIFTAGLPNYLITYYPVPHELF
jgi:hypothetical protein